MLSFDAETGLVAPSTADIRTDVAALFTAAFAGNGLPALNTEPETPAGQLIDSITAIIADKNAEILYLANQFNPLTAEGVWQAALGKIYFLTPKTATNSVAVCTCTGLAGTVIAAGSIIQSSVDNMQWQALSTVTLTQSGTAQIEFQCMTAGEVSAGSNTLTRIVTTTPGWDTVTNSAAAIVGTLAETQLAFEQRRYASVALNARGSIAALYAALSQVDGVIDLAILENDTTADITTQGVTIPAHSIWITIVGGEDADIAAVIYRNKDVGCGTAGNTEITHTATEIPLYPVYTYNIERPESLSIAVSVTIRETSSLPGNIEQLIKDAVQTNFNGGSSFSRAGTAQTLYASRFYADIIAQGVLDLVGVEIAYAPAEGESASWQSQLDIDADQEPVLSDDDITVTILTV